MNYGECRVARPSARSLSVSQANNLPAKQMKYYRECSRAVPLCRVYEGVPHTIIPPPFLARKGPGDVRIGNLRTLLRSEASANESSQVTQSIQNFPRR